MGSISGPILFNIFVNDIKEKLNMCTLVQYADNTQFLLSSTIDNLDNLITRAEEAIRNAKSYFTENGLLMNDKKTQCVFIGSRQLLSRILNNTTLKVNNGSDNNYGNSIIVPSNHVKNLEVYFDNYEL